MSRYIIQETIEHSIISISKSTEENEEQEKNIVSNMCQAENINLELQS